MTTELRIIAIFFPSYFWNIADVNKDIKSLNKL